ncbi:MULTISPECIES: hypothetical protein [unclassified Variovorax]|uniref:hypothetical protein n=1 Tax=unclassified Variovorax TaxID=663243 RepID=UPI003F4849C2
MTPKELLNAAEKQPTVGSLDEELQLIRNIRALTLGDIEQDLPSFIALVEVVQTWHADNGIFEMGEAEEAHTVGFFNWLRSLEQTLNMPLTKHADGLELTRAEMAKKMSP